MNRQAYIDRMIAQADGMAYADYFRLVLVMLWNL